MLSSIDKKIKSLESSVRKEQRDIKVLKKAKRKVKKRLAKLK